MIVCLGQREERAYLPFDHAFESWDGRDQKCRWNSVQQLSYDWKTTIDVIAFLGKLKSLEHLNSNLWVLWNSIRRNIGDSSEISQSIPIAPYDCPNTHCVTTSMVNACKRISRRTTSPAFADFCKASQKDCSFCFTRGTWASILLREK